MSTAIPHRDDEYFLEEIDGEMLLYHAAKSETLYLNESAAIVWYLCDGERSEQDIVDLLAQSYPEDSENIPNQVKESLQSFIEFGGVTLGEPAE